MTILGKKQMSEEDIKLNYITPVILKGWKGHITMETKITDGRINIRGNIVARSKPKFADYMLYLNDGKPIAVVEAKDNNHSVSHGLQQAMTYAQMMDLPFAYSSNGDAFYEHDYSPELIRHYEIGTGMFAVETWTPGDQISFVRSDYFHGEPAPTRRIVYRLIKEESSRLIALQTGEIDICVDPLNTDLGYIEDDPNLELVKVPNYVMLYLAINNERKGLDNVHVRKAIAYATDKASMIEVGYNGEGFVHDHWINRGQFGWDDNLQVYEYNLDKAKEELELSGYKPGDLKFRVIYNGTAKENMALVLQADLAEVGIELELIKMETAALKGILNDAALDYDLCLYQFTDNLGTDFTLRNQYGSYEEDGVLKKNGSNRANMKDAKFNEMIDAALIEQDSAKREKMYNEIEEYLNEIVPIVPIATSYVNIGIKKGITGVKWNGTAKHDYRYVCLPVA